MGWGKATIGCALSGYLLSLDGLVVSNIVVIRGLSIHVSGSRGFVWLHARGPIECMPGGLWNPPCIFLGEFRAGEEVARSRSTMGVEIGVRRSF